MAAMSKMTGRRTRRACLVRSTSRVVHARRRQPTAASTPKSRSRTSARRAALGRCRPLARNSRAVSGPSGSDRTWTRSRASDGRGSGVRSRPIAARVPARGARVSTETAARTPAKASTRRARSTRLSSTSTNAPIGVRASVTAPRDARAASTSPLAKRSHRRTVTQRDPASARTNMLVAMRSANRTSSNGSIATTTLPIRSPRLAMALLDEATAP
jgi:hypothetical protein